MKIMIIISVQLIWHYRLFHPHDYFTWNSLFLHSERKGEACVGKKNQSRFRFIMYTTDFLDPGSLLALWFTTIANLLRCLPRLVAFIQKILPISLSNRKLVLNISNIMLFQVLSLGKMVQTGHLKYIGFCEYHLQSSLKSEHHTCGF